MRHRKDVAVATLFDLAARYRKAIAAALLPGLAIVGPTLAVGDLPTREQWISAGFACVLTALGVGAIPNRPKDEEARA